MKHALLDKVTGAVRQWQDHSQFSYPPAPVDELLELPDDFEFPQTPRWVVDGALTDVDPDVVTLVVSHETLVEQARAAARTERQPILNILDGLQVSALTKSDMSLAQQIEAIKAGMRDITTLDLSGDVDAEAMRAHIQATYDALIATAPASVKQAFATS